MRLWKNRHTCTDFVILWHILLCRVLQVRSSSLSCALVAVSAKEMTNAIFVSANKPSRAWNSAWNSGPSPLHQLHITRPWTSPNPPLVHTQSTQDQHLHLPHKPLLQSLQQQPGKNIQWSSSSPEQAGFRPSHLILQNKIEMVKCLMYFSSC